MIERERINAIIGQYWTPEDEKLAVAWAASRIDELEKLVDSQAERIHAQHELLSKRAARPVPAPAPVKTMNIASKQQMYEHLVRGDFGNAVPQWFSLHDWLADPSTRAFPLWGIRSLTPMDKRMFLDVPIGDVPEMVTKHHGGLANLSPMVDPFMIFRCEVFEADFAPCGLRVWGTADRELKWREAFRHTAREWSGVAANAILRNYLWPNDYEDLMTLLERYPGHVVEMTVCDRAVGKIPMRNTVIWEVRNY